MGVVQRSFQSRVKRKERIERMRREGQSVVVIANKEGLTRERIYQVLRAPKVREVGRPRTILRPREGDGLQAGHGAQERQVAETFEPEPFSAESQTRLRQPISVLNLSVRAHNGMIRLRINTLADLIRRTGDDLLKCWSFGVTSLREVREKLAAIGLRLRGE